MTAARALTLTLAADQSPATDAVMADWLVRSYLPAVLDHTPVGAVGEQLRLLPPITAEIVQRPGKLRAYVAPARTAASAIESIEFEGFEQPDGTILCPEAPVDEREVLLGTHGLAAADQTRKALLPAKAGWWAYYGLCSASRWLSHPDRATNLAAAIEDAEASYRAMWTRVYGVAGTTLELDVQAGAT